MIFDPFLHRKLFFIFLGVELCLGTFLQRFEKQIQVFPNKKSLLNIDLP